MKAAKFWKEAEWRKSGWVPEDEYKSRHASRSSGWTRQDEAPHGKWEESPYTGPSSSWSRSQSSWGKAWNTSAEANWQEENADQRYERMSQSTPWRATGKQSERLNLSDENPVESLRQQAPSDYRDRERQLRSRYSAGDSSDREHKRRRRSDTDPDDAATGNWNDQDDRYETADDSQQWNQAPPTPSRTTFERALNEDLQREKPGWLSIELAGPQFWEGPVQCSVHLASGWILEYTYVHE